MRKVFVVIASLFVAHYFYGQLQTYGAAPNPLVQNVLLGPGVEVSNTNFTGAGQAIGGFTAFGTNLGIDEGIVLTTGTIYNNGDGPHGPNNTELAGVDNGFPGYYLLNNLSGGQTYNASVLEFDVVPYSDTVRFNYVFGSEEYLEFVGSQFNDAFGLFIAGPGITGDPGLGPYKNIAELPNGTPVAINNIHSATTNAYGSFPAENAGYYVNNSGGGTIQYDGFTRPLEAVARVQCGETYHLIIAVADVGDGIYDSGVFLEAGSLTSKTPVEIVYELSTQAFPEPNKMAEGCVSATFTLSRENNFDEQLEIPINITGSATEGTDYTDIPNSVTFQPGESEIQFSLDAFEDGIPEGVENINVEFIMTDPCGNITPYSVELLIEDVMPVDVTLEDVEVVCAGDEVTLTPDITGGVNPYSYEWNTGETTETITVSPDVTTSYSVTVSDFCTGEEASATAEVFVPEPPPITLDASDDLSVICPYIPEDFYVSASGGSGNFTYQWTSDQGETLGQDSIQNVIPSQTTVYTVTVTDQCGAIATEEIEYEITSPPLIVTISPDTTICPGDSALLTASATGGFGDYFFYWSHSGETSTSVWVDPSRTTSYQVVVSDECQTFSVAAQTTVFVVKPTAAFIPISGTLFNNLPITFENHSQNGISYEWNFGDGQTSTDVHPSNQYNEPGNYTISLIVTDEYGCKDTTFRHLFVEEEYYLYVPNAFTPDDDRINNYFEASTYGINQLEIRIFNRWGEVVFHSNNPRFRWDGTFKGQLCQDGTYTWKISYLTNSGRELKAVGHVNLVK